MDSQLDQSVATHNVVHTIGLCQLFRQLADDVHMSLQTNPIDSHDGQALYQRCQDGILLW
jgi:hypothetical protein